LKRNYITFAKVVAGVEFASFPLLVVAFVLLNQITSFAIAVNANLSSAPAIGFLEKQYTFLSNHELISPRVVCALHLFGFFIFFCIIVMPLRLISAPALFSMLDWRKIARKDNSSIFRLVVLFFIVGAGCVWSSVGLEDSSKTPLLKVLMFHWPTAFIGLETLSFVFGVVCLTEGFLACVQLLSARRAD
jgi:hypothetical protein